MCDSLKKALPFILALGCIALIFLLFGSSEGKIRAYATLLTAGCAVYGATLATQTFGLNKSEAVSKKKKRQMSLICHSIKKKSYIHATYLVYNNHDTVVVLDRFSFDPEADSWNVLVYTSPEGSQEHPIQRISKDIPGEIMVEPKVRRGLKIEVGQAPPSSLKVTFFYRFVDDDERFTHTLEI